MNCLRSIVFVTIVFIGLCGPSMAATKSGCIPGTYLIQESGGAQSLWTFSKDRTFQMASSAQGVFNFSHSQGAWRQSRSLVAKATFLNFTYGQSVSPSNVARVDADLTFSKKCSTVQGNFTLRFFDPDTEDPLDPESDSGDPITDTFTGRRVTVSK